MIKKLTILAATAMFVFAGVGSAFAYDVKSGDTMYNIAKTHEMTLGELASLNPQVQNLDLIFVNQIIKTSSNNSQVVSQPVQKEVSKAVTKSTQEPKAVSSANTSERELLARLVRAEAQGESYIGKVAVAEVVLNRVDSSQFPNSIKGVIYQPGQFSPVANGSLNRAADSASVKAVNEALAGSNYVGNDSLFFYNARTATSRWLDGRPTTTVIGSHTFKK